MVALLVVNLVSGCCLKDCPVAVVYAAVYIIVTVAIVLAFAAEMTTGARRIEAMKGNYNSVRRKGNKLGWRP